MLRMFFGCSRMDDFVGYVVHGYKLVASIGTFTDAFSGLFLNADYEECWLLCREVSSSADLQLG